MDERDTIFARMARRPGTPSYEDYYGRRDDLQAVDDRLRAMPHLGRPGGRYHDPALAREAFEFFEAIPHLQPEPGLVQERAGDLRRTDRPVDLLKDLAVELGAVAVGCAPLEQRFVYTHRGRHDADYGQAVDLDHRFALVFLVEMDLEAMWRAPGAPTLRESARQYLRAARIAGTVAAVLRAAGHQARPQYDASYDVILPPLAVRAGLGELGRNNILIADRFGSRVRIGAVTTDLDLPPDRPVSLGAARFCEVCRKCAESCPSRALATGDRQEVRGVWRWTTQVERCYGYWRQAGTDCGICMACCPFSHPDSALHNLVRALVRRFPGLHRLAVLGDDLVYGRRWRGRS